MFDWENEEYDNTHDELEREVAPYLDIAAKLPGIVLEGQRDLQESDADGEKDENEEAVESERNCTLDNLPMQKDKEISIMQKPA